MKKFILFLIITAFALFSPAIAADLDFDQDDDSKIDSTYLDFSHDITGAVECDGAGTCEQAEYEDLSNYNSLDPDYLAGDTTDDNLIDVGVINTTALKVTLSTDDLWTLSGRTEGSQHLGTFTGAIIDDNLTVKAAFQDLETYVEGLGGGHDPITLSTTLNSNLLGLSTQQITLDSQAINTVFAGPASGGSAAPSFRALVAADIPDISATYETQLVNEAGLYSALSDVSDFIQPGDTVQTGSATSLPGSCTTGDMYIDTDADTDGTLYICVDTDTWKDVDDDGSTGSDVLAKVSSNETDADYLVNQIGSANGEIDVTETGSGDETLNLAIDVTPSSGSASLEIANDAINVKINANDFDISTNGLYIDYTNGQAAASGVKGFLTGTDWDTFNAKESETHASEHAVSAADTVFPADPGADRILFWDDDPGTLEWASLGSDLAYDGSNLSIVDDSHNHVYSNIDAFTEANLYTILSDVSQFYEPGDAASFSSVTFTDEDASPTVAGQLKYDNTITGLVDGGLVWYDDDEVQLVVSVAMADFGTGPTDDYVVAYDAINDKHYYIDSGGVGGNTKFNLIEDADADGTIDLAGYEQTITTSIDESGGVALTIKHTDSDGLTNDTYLMELIHVNDGDAQAHFIRGLDNNGDELWKIDYQGVATFKAVATSGTATPGYTFMDTDCPGSEAADKEIAKIYANYLSGAEDSEDGGLYLQVMIAGTERTILEYDADTEAMTLGSSEAGEDLVVDFDTGVANEVTVTSNSGVDVIDFGTINVEADQFESDVSTGTAPLIVASTTVVTNLNADTVDGESASEIVTAARVGGVSANLDDTDASIEWEDAAALESDGSLSANTVDSDQYVDGSIDNEHLADDDFGDFSVSSGVATLDRTRAQDPDIATPSSWTMSGDPLYGGTFIASGSSTASVPAVGSEMNFSVITESTNVATLDPNGSELIYLNGASCGAGVTIVSSGTAGDMAVFQYRSSGAWTVQASGFTCGS